jgi:hypothetical protein
MADGQERLLPEVAKDKLAAQVGDISAMQSRAKDPLGFPRSPSLDLLA